MRRALLTASSAPPAPTFTVGNTGTFGTTSFGSARTAVDISDPATATGTVTSVSIACQTAGTIYIMVGSYSGGTFTVRSISGALTAAIGLNTFTVSLSTVIGDYIGYFSPSSGGSFGRYATGVTGSNTGYNLSSPTVPPSPGANISLLTDANTRMSILGTG